MVKILSKMSVSVGDANNLSIRGHLRTHKQSIQAELERLGYAFQRYGSRDSEYFFCEIVEDSQSDKLKNVKSILRQAGLEESIHAVIPSGDRETHFGFNLIRSFSKEDINQAEFLRLNVKGHQRIADWKESTASGLVVKANGRLKNKLDFGWLDIVIVPYVTDKGRKHLESMKFKGIDFRSAIFDQPEKAVRKLYQLTSFLSMPSCLLPIQNSNGDVVSVEFNKGARIWDDAGYVQPILKYYRDEVCAMGDFDIANTREQIGNIPEHYVHQLIVSQRFKRYIETMNVRSVEFVPVELIDG